MGTLQPQLGSTPHSPLRVESDRITGSHSYPLRNRAILSLLLRQNTLDHEPLVGRHLPPRIHVVQRPEYRRACAYAQSRPLLHRKNNIIILILLSMSVNVYNIP